MDFKWKLICLRERGRRDRGEEYGIKLATVNDPANGRDAYIWFDRLVGGGRPLMAARRPRDDVRIKRRIEHEGEEEKRLDESKTRLVAVRGKSPSRRKCD